MKERLTSATGKIIISGEYAVVFGHEGIAFPSRTTLSVIYDENPESNSLETQWTGIQGSDQWDAYLKTIVQMCEQMADKKFTGKIKIENELPLGKGMGSSTALVIALAKNLLGNHKIDEAKAIEDALNPGNSGLDFAVIWEGKPLKFKSGSPPLELSHSFVFMDRAMLIDTGLPEQATHELVSWVKERESEVQQALEMIGSCTDRLLKGENPHTVFRDHHQAQVTLGVVPPQVQKLISSIQHFGGSAKVIGAGARTGGGGMVLAIHDNPDILEENVPLIYPPFNV